MPKQNYVSETEKKICQQATILVRLIDAGYTIDDGTKFALDLRALLEQAGYLKAMDRVNKTN